MEEGKRINRLAAERRALPGCTKKEGQGLIGSLGETSPTRWLLPSPVRRKPGRDWVTDRLGASWTLSERRLVGAAKVARVDRRKIRMGLRKRFQLHPEFLNERNRAFLIIPHDLGEFRHLFSRDADLAQEENGQAPTQDQEHEKGQMESGAKGFMRCRQGFERWRGRRWCRRDR